MSEELTNKDSVDEIDETELEDISGGEIFNAGKHASLRSRPWEVLDAAGRAVYRASRKSGAMKWAKENGYNTDRIYLSSTLRRMRECANRASYLYTPHEK